MNQLLARKLIEKGAIRQGTLVEIWYKTCGLSCSDDSLVRGCFVIDRAAVQTDQTVVFYTTGPRRRFTTDDVLSIDGMDINRFAKIYGLQVDGNEIVVGRRRGRRPNPVAVSSQLLF